jgi:MoxR-like ATPase
VKYSDIKRSVLANFARGNTLVPFIVGKPGGGKSSLAREIVAELGIDPSRVTEFNPSVRDPVDILGLPRVDGEHSSWLPPSEFWRIRDDGTDRPCALIIEEITDASIPMQNPLCRVVLWHSPKPLDIFYSAV